MLVNLVGPFLVNRPFGTEIAFSKGLQAIGVDVHEVDPNLGGQALMPEADYTVVFKTAMDYNQELLGMRGKVVVYQPDDLHYPHIKAMMREMRRFAEHALVFQGHGLQECRDIGYTTAKVLGLTADPYLYRPLKRTGRPIDLCFVGSMGDPVAHASRREMLMRLQQNGFEVRAFSTNDVHGVNYLYNSSKIVLNHAADVGLGFGRGRGYQCRHFEAGFARSCLVSNQMDDEPLAVVGFERFESFDDLVELCRCLLADEDLRDRMAECLYEDVMVNHHPVVRAKQLVRILESL